DALGVHFDEWTESVPDRPNHDRRYLIEPAKAEKELGFRPTVGLEQGISDTVAWYRDHEAWWQELIDRRELQLDWTNGPGGPPRASRAAQNSSPVRQPEPGLGRLHRGSHCCRHCRGRTFGTHGTVGTARSHGAGRGGPG